MQHGTSYMDMMVDVSGNFERQIIICSLSIVVVMSVFSIAFFSVAVWHVLNLTRTLAFCDCSGYTSAACRPARCW